jgi:hypothetical protein
MSRLQFELKVLEGGLHAWLSVSDEGGGSISGPLDAADMDEFIRILGTIRESLAEQVPLRLELPARVRCIIDPGWWCDPKPKQRLLALRHPGYGWLGFALPTEQARKLAGLLLESGPAEPKELAAHGARLPLRRR